LIFLENRVRWLGEIEDIPIIGLQSIDSTLPGQENLSDHFSNIFSMF
jgi:hypothetical protein